MLYIYLFIWLSLSERFLNISLGSLQLGLGDILLILAPLVLVFQNYKISRWSFVAAVLTFFLLAQVALFNDMIGLNATITIPLRLIISGLIYQQLKQLRAVVRWQKVIFSTLIFCLLLITFLSGVTFSKVELFNRNELISYILVFSAIYLCLIQRKTISNQKLISIHCLIILIFLIAVLIAESRQGITVLALILLCYFIQTITWKNFLRTTLLACSILLSLTAIMSVQFNDEYGQSRINTIQTFQPQTQADTFRLRNALFVINNFQSSPYLGHGNNSFVKDGPFRKVVHNAYLSTLYEFGFIGLSFLIFCMILIIRPYVCSVRKRNQLPLSLKLPAPFLVGIAVQAMFIEVLAKPPIFIILGCAMFVSHCQLQFLKNNR